MNCFQSARDHCRVSLSELLVLFELLFYSFWDLVVEVYSEIGRPTFFPITFFFFFGQKILTYIVGDLFSLSFFEASLPKILCDSWVPV